MSQPTSDADTRLAQTEDKLLLLQQRASQVVRLVLRQVESDIPKSMANFLKLVSDRPIRVTEVAKLDGVAQPTVTALVNQAEDRGWVSRTRDPLDGRVTLVFITPAGRQARTRLHEAITTLLREKTRKMSETEVNSLLSAADALLLLIDALQDEGL